MSDDLDSMLEEMEIHLTSAVDLADETATKLQRRAPGAQAEQITFATESDSIESVRRLRLRLRDAKSFVATRRAHLPFVDIKIDEVPNALANIRLLAERLPAKEQLDLSLTSPERGTADNRLARSNGGACEPVWRSARD
jgi:hypothetical protein